MGHCCLVIKEMWVQLYNLCHDTSLFIAPADSQLLCGSLRYLDDCRYQIPPLEKKYDLQNMESKTAYHCDCTTR